MPILTRRWLQFRLRTILGLMIVACLVFGWYAHARKVAGIRQNTVGRILESGGAVYYDYQRDRAGEWQVNALPPTPSWLRDAIGPEFGRRVIRVNLAACGVEDGDLKPLQALTSLQGLMLQHNQITDGGLIHIARLSQLRRLHLNENEISDDGLVHLEKLSNLELLDLSKTRVTDSGLHRLTTLLHLQHLHLNETQVSQEAVQELKTQLPNCDIYLDGAPTASDVQVF